MGYKGMDDVLKDISLRFYKNIRVTKAICEHPLLFAKQRIEDPNDIRPIMIMYFAKFVMKNRKTMENKQTNVKKHERIIAQRCNRKLNKTVETNVI